MKKHIVLIFTSLVLCTLAFSGCSASEDSTLPSGAPGATSTASSSLEQTPDSSKTGETEDILYSNLADSDSQKEIASILQEHGISEKQTDTLMEWADDFNKRVQTPFSEGFQKMALPENDYSNLVYDSKEAEDGSLLPEANCRLTAFLLMKRFISTNGKKDKSDTYLMFDIEAIDTEAQFKMSKKDRSNYYSLYNWIPVKNLKTVEQHTDAIQKAWKERDIQIDNSTGVSLICVYMHTTFEDVRIVGHVGVLLEQGDKLLFIEKYGPAAPFQAIWYHNRKELQTALLARKDLYGDEDEVAPIVMENGQVMKTE